MCVHALDSNRSDFPTIRCELPAESKGVREIGASRAAKRKRAPNRRLNQYAGTQIADFLDPLSPNNTTHTHTHAFRPARIGYSSSSSARRVQVGEIVGSIFTYTHTAASWHSVGRFLMHSEWQRTATKPRCNDRKLGFGDFLVLFPAMRRKDKIYIHVHTQTHTHIYIKIEPIIVRISAPATGAKRERESTCNLFVSSLQSDWQCRAPQTVSMGRHVMPFVSMMAA